MSYPSINVGLGASPSGSNPQAPVGSVSSPASESTDRLEKSDSVAVVSGGMDSVTMLYAMVKNLRLTPLVLSFYYGQKHNKELGFAKEHARELGLQWKQINLDMLSDLLDRSTLVAADKPVPDGHYADEVMKQTVVPNRNMMMMAIAAAACVNIGGSDLGVGMHAGDHPIYPDCRPVFVEWMQDTIILANEGFIHRDFSVYAPFINVGKHEIVATGMDLGVPYERTWSCYKGDKHHCGTCGTCVERKEAFQLAGVDDPTTYVTIKSNVPGAHLG
jgi:7-cyano-7-deazaguanine synthase